MTSDVLRQEIERRIKEGYRVVSETEASAQMMKPKVFSFAWAFLWFLFFGVGVLVYIFYYLGKKDQTVYVQVEPDGSLKGWESGGGRSSSTG